MPGASLLFITIPSVFASMPLGGVFMVLFFVLAAVAATGAMLSLFEVPVAYLTRAVRLEPQNGHDRHGSGLGGGGLDGGALE